MKPLLSVARTVLVVLLLVCYNLVFSQTITRGPYLQSGTKTTIIIHWRTNVASNARVRIGTSYIAAGTYATIINDATSTTEHIVTVTGLTADTKYFYSIGTSAAVLQSGTDNFFTTLPPSNPGRKLRFAAFGDCGRNSSTYQDQTLTQYQSFLTTNSIEAPDAWLLLGDNAYNAGLDAEFTTNFFGIYGATILKNHKLYPVPGNHDYANNTTNQDTHAVPYYSIFDLPKLGEACDIVAAASNKEEFYSFDVGNVHFLALDAYGEESNLRLYDTLGAQVAWIKSDLDKYAFTGKWIIAYWHHPPYTFGSHNSDSESELINMRENFIRILERYGVDMIINGHSHDYERSKLMKGYYKVNPGDLQLNNVNFNASYNVSSSFATYSSAATCPYVTSSTASNKGTVYVVAGSTGASGSTQAPYPHNALPKAVNDGGVFYFEVDGNRLDAKFIQKTGAIFDQFTIMRDVNKTTNYSILNGSSKTLTASWPQSGVYTWTPGAAGTAKSVSVSPPPNATTNYTVTDAFGCVTDHFAVTTSSTLPVTLVNYDVKLAGNKVNINWTTSSEVNSNRFTIERSLDGRDFAAIGTVNAAGNTSITHKYSFVDQNPAIGSNYYRLLLTNLDNRNEYLGIRRIDYTINKAFNVKTVSTSGKLALQINTGNKGLYHIRVFDMAGRERKNEIINIYTAQTTEEIDLSPGVYVWEVKDSKGISVSQKVIIH